MRIFIISAGLILSSLFSPLVWANPYSEPAKAADVTDIAMDLAKSKRFTDALHTLESASYSSKLGYDHRFTKARILSWSGDHFQAQSAFEGLLRDYPQNADVMVAAGYSYYFSSDLNRAHSLFQNVVSRHPDYLDAHLGLDKVVKALDANAMKMAAQNANAGGGFAQPQGRPHKQAAPIQYNSASALNCPAGFTLHADGYCLKSQTSKITYR